MVWSSVKSNNSKDIKLYGKIFRGEETTFNEIFEVDIELNEVFRRLKYGYTGKENYSVIFDAITQEPLEMQLAFWAEVDHYKELFGFILLGDDVSAYQNPTMVQNFAERFGWNKDKLIFKCIR